MFWGNLEAFMIEASCHSMRHLSNYKKCFLGNKYLRKQNSFSIFKMVENELIFRKMSSLFGHCFRVLMKLFWLWHLITIKINLHIFRNICQKKNILNDNRVIAFLIQDKQADLFVRTHEIYLRKLLMLWSITGGSTIVYNISVPTLSSDKIKIFQLSIMDAIIIWTNFVT